MERPVTDPGRGLEDGSQRHQIDSERVDQPGSTVIRCELYEHQLRLVSTLRVKFGIQPDALKVLDFLAELDQALLGVNHWALHLDLRGAPLIASPVALG